MTPPSTGPSLPRQGLLLLVALPFFWGVNWPAMKITMAEMTPWTYRSITGVTGAIGHRGYSAPPCRISPSGS